MTALPVDAPAVVSLTHLDEDWAVPCEFLPRGQGGCGGDAGAEWIAHWLPCCPERAATFWCDRCLTAILAAGFLGCGHCNREYVPPRSGLTTIEPLNRRTT
jgi:hypothetical protein